MPTLSFGGGSHLGVPWRGALLGHVEREEGKTSSDQYPKGLKMLSECKSGPVPALYMECPFEGITGPTACVKDGMTNSPDLVGIHTLLRGTA